MVDRDTDPVQKKQRTPQQNKSLWLYYELLAESLNNAGLDQRKVLKPSIEIPWTKQAVHDRLWIPIQNAMFNTDSTTELNTSGIDKIAEVLIRHLGSQFNVPVTEFPSISHELHEKQAREYEQR